MGLTIVAQHDCRQVRPAGLACLRARIWAPGIFLFRLPFLAMVVGARAYPQDDGTVRVKVGKEAPGHVTNSIFLGSERPKLVMRRCS